MYKKILNDNQQKLLPLIKEFKREYYLVGGTTIALYLGHRRSVDFDLFKKTSIRHKLILEKIAKHKEKYVITRNVDYSEKVEYLIPFDESLVKPFLTNLALDF